MTMRWSVLAVSGAALCCAALLIAWSWSPPPTPWLYLPLRSFGVVAIGIGTLAWHSRSWSAIGHLIVAVGMSYYLQDLQVSTNVVVFAAGFCLAYLWTAVVAHLVLTWPIGRAEHRGIRWLIGTCYLAAVGSQAFRFVADQPRPPLQPMGPYNHTFAAKLASVLVTVLTLVVVLVVARRWARANRLRRGPAAPIWAAIIIAGILGTFASIASLLEAPLRVEYALLLMALIVAVLLVPTALLTRSSRLLRLRWRLSALVLDRDQDLDLRTGPDLLQRELIEILGDATLRLAYPLTDGSFIDVFGRPFKPNPQRALTTVRRHSEIIALVEHDDALRQQQAIAATTQAVVGLAIEGARRYALLRAQVEQIRTSRLRLATIAFEERHRIQRDLHDGAQQQLLAVLVLLDIAQRDPSHATTPDLVRRAHAQLSDAIATLRHLTQGIYPATLVEHGLAAAVEGLADLAPLPVSFTVPPLRWPRHIEATAYFTITESLANTYKHAHASHVDITVAVHDTTLTIEIADDGIGGASPDAGSGLRGLHDRIATVDGTLRITSPPGHGTCITAAIPLTDPRERQ